MKRYKLIKHYPSAPPPGTIVREDKFGQYITETLIIFQKSEVEDYPEFWKEIKEPEFKIGDTVVVTEQYATNTAKTGNIGKLTNYQRNSVVPYEVNGSWCKNVRLATPEEIETHLIAEAKKRGFTKGIKVVRPEGMSCRAIETLKDDKIWYHDDNTLVINGVTIYEDGKWAEIVKEEEIKIGEYIARFDFPNSGSNTVSFGCKKYTFSEIISLYENCLVFGINSILAHNHTIDFMVIKRTYDEIKKHR